MTTLNDAAVFLSGGTPKKGVAKFWDGDIPWISAANMRSKFISTSDFNITQEGLIKHSRLAPKGATLLLVRGSGLFNSVPICFADSPVAFNQDVKAICAKPGIDPTYLHFVIEALRPKLEENISLTGIGAGKFDLAFLKGLPFPLLPFEKQKALGHIVEAFDRKIDLNRRINDTLEAMTATLFRDWLVDFGPTRAKMMGKAPYLAPDLWALFPDHLDDETGLPFGWHQCPLDEVAEFLNGLALQKFPVAYDEPSLPVVKIAELRNGISKNTDRASRLIPEKYLISDGDFLFSWSGSLMAKFWTQGEGALNQHLFKVTSARYPAWFFSQWVHYHLDEFQAIAASKATTMGHIQRGHLKAAMTNCPPVPMLEALGQVISPLIEATINNDLEAQNLARMRDLLLPKLIYGEIRLSDAEKIAGESL